MMGLGNHFLHHPLHHVVGICLVAVFLVHPHEVLPDGLVHDPVPRRVVAVQYAERRQQLQPSAVLFGQFVRNPSTLFPGPDFA